MKLLPRINPVTLKELRQLVRSRLIVWGMMVLPLIYLTVTGLVLSAEMHGIDPVEATYGKGLGTGTLAAVSIITGLVTCGAIPLFAAIKTVLETGNDKLGLEFTTTLTPAQIISGKITAVAIISAIAVALAMPFFVLSYLMRGVDLSTTVVLPITLFASGVAMFSIGLLPSCARRPVAIRIILLLLMYMLLPTIGSGIVEIMSIGGGLWLSSSSNPITLADVAILVFLFVAVVAYCRAQAAAELAPPHLDSVRPLRITHALLFVASIPIVFKSWEAWTSIWLVVAALILLRAAYYPAALTRGAVLHAPRSRLLRMLAFPFATGSIPSIIFALLIMAVSVVGVIIYGDTDDIELAIVLAFEFGGFLTIVGCAGRLLLQNHKRLAGAIGKIALGYIILVNALTIVAETDAIDEHTVRPMLCNLDGIKSAISQHYVLALMSALIAAILLGLTAIIEFDRFRRK